MTSAFTRASNNSRFCGRLVPGKVRVSPMRVEIVEEAEGNAPTPVFPPDENFLDLRANPQKIDGVATAGQYLPLRNFLTSVNSEESIFATASAITKSDLPAVSSVGSAYEFASQTRIVFAEPSLNWERKHFANLSSDLKELLERDAAKAVRAVLRISSCDFTAGNRRGFCLSIRLVTVGSSPQQAELRWGLGLARIQQALLFRSRALKQKIVEGFLRAGL